MAIWTRTTYDAHFAVEGEPADSEDLTDGYNHVADKEKLHFSAQPKSAQDMYSGIGKIRTFFRRQPSSFAIAIVGTMKQAEQWRIVIWSLVVV